MAQQPGLQGAVEMVQRTFTAVGRRQTNLYHIEGFRLHERALRANLNFELSLISASLSSPDAEREATLLANVTAVSSRWYVIADDLMAELSNGRGLGGLISLLKIPAQPTLAELVKNRANPLLLVAADVIDPGNVGAMIRTGHANQIAAFIPLRASDPFHPKAVRTSMGSLFKTAVCHYQQPESLFADLADLGISSIGAAISPRATLLPETSFSQAGTAVFMGNEYHGLPPAILSKLDRLVEIPMAVGIDSLSVNAATAVILYEIQRQETINRRQNNSTR